MKHTSRMFVIMCLLAMVAACAIMSPSSKQLGTDYLSKAQELEQEGDLVEAYKHYQLALTVQPDNQIAKDKVAEIGPQLNARADEQYRNGLQFYKMGQYPQARQAFLTALRYNPEHPGAKEKLAEFDRGISTANRYIPHTVKSGESISSLAAKYYGDYRKFHLIAKYNEIEDATRLKVGQEIKIPVLKGTPIIGGGHDIRTESGEDPGPMTDGVLVVKRYVVHTVKPGESLSKIADTYYGDFKRYDVIAKFNGLPSATSISVGQELKIPETAETPLITGEPVEMPPSPQPSKQEPAPAVGVTDNGGMTDNYRDLGKELYAKKDFDGAITEFSKVLNTVPDDPEANQYMAKAYYEKGRQAFRQGQYPQAVKAFESTLKYDKNCKDCRQLIEQSRQKSKSAGQRQKAVALYQTQKYDQAIVALEKIAKADPKDAEVRRYLAKSHYQHGLELFDKEEYLKARDAFQASLKYDPKCEQCEPNIAKSENMFKDRHYRQGLADFQKERLTEAIQQWEMVYNLDPNYRDVQRNLEKARTLLKRLESIKRSQGTESQ